MKTTFSLPAVAVAFALALPTLALAAAPKAGDVLGKTPDEVKVALEKAGCTVTAFGAEDGMVEAKCTDKAGMKHEVYIDPSNGTVTNVKMVK